MLVRDGHEMKLVTYLLSCPHSTLHLVMGEGGTGQPQAFEHKWTLAGYIWLVPGTAVLSRLDDSMNEDDIMALCRPGALLASRLTLMLLLSDRMHPMESGAGSQAD